MEKTIEEYLSGQVAKLRAEIDEITRRIAPLQIQLNKAERALEAAKSVADETDESTHIVATTSGGTTCIYDPAVGDYTSDFRSLTMKDLTVKALKEHFRNGATSSQLLEFFADKWGRSDIMRTSFSPQLSRLKNEGMISLVGKVWVLEDGHPKKNEPPEGGSEGGGAVTSPIVDEGHSEGLPSA